MELVRAGIQPSEIWKMTVPEYVLLMIRTREDSLAEPQNEAQANGTVIHCESMEDFALALATTRGRID